MNIDEFLGYFKEEFFIKDLKSKSKNDILEEMVNHIADQSTLKDSTLILEMLKRREEIGSTGIGHGIAIPHGRTISVPDLITVYGKSANSIEFDAIDKKPVNMVFMIIAPPQEQSNTYLPFLGKLVDILNSKKVRKELINANTFEEFTLALAGGF
ncbi:PTS sugar transporter subunit IIA [candidate division KSB1 bacterium]|nr:PTS sugar transporter subunit IIA [candidate division KSB1 bacterium]